VCLLQPLQGGDHLLAASKRSTAGIGTELAPALNHIHDDTREDTGTSSATIEVIRKPGPWPRSVLKTVLSTMLPMMRDRKITNVFTTALDQRQRHHVPVGDVGDSWPITASASSRFIVASSRC